MCNRANLSGTRTPPNQLRGRQRGIIQRRNVTRDVRRIQPVNRLPHNDCAEWDDVCQRLGSLWNGVNRVVLFVPQHWQYRVELAGVDPRLPLYSTFWSRNFDGMTSEGLQP